MIKLIEFLSSPKSSVSTKVEACKTFTLLSKKIIEDDTSTMNGDIKFINETLENATKSKNMKIQNEAIQSKKIWEILLSKNKNINKIQSPK